MAAKMWSPWGEVQHRQKLADGIDIVDTAGHGGIWLDRERRKAFYDHPAFRGFQTFTGLAEWFEEDCDAAAAILRFASEFKASEIRGAVQSADISAKWESEGRHGERRGWLTIQAWLDESPDGQRLRGIVKEFERDMASKWERGGMGGGGGMPANTWDVTFHKVADRSIYKTVRIVGYPGQQFWSDEEIDAVTYREPASV